MPGLIQLRASGVDTVRAVPGTTVFALTGKIPARGTNWTAVAFVWDTVSGADDYRIQVGPSSGVYTTHDQHVGYVLTVTLTLPPGTTYYSRVIPYTGGAAGTPTTERTVTV